ncbi:HAD family hydrolase [Aestuariibacter salexigens]|uniref:HAD family hydrolase n=1 Tax=Aestuariibacter salexigens TaxID=226010 RepID=UPI000404018A|nr:HAD family hydrolase [Aestuariibacter salexigens]
MTRRVFVFDVDGVIVDSTDECMLVCFNALQIYSGNPEKCVSNLESIPEAFQHIFKPVRKYVRSMDEYFCLSRKEAGLVKTQRDYDTLICSLSVQDKHKFGNIFFAQRERLKRQNFTYWMSLNTMYEGIKGAIENVYRQCHVFVVTGKDGASVIDIFNYLGVPIQPEHIYDKNAAKDKLACLELIHKNTGIDPSDILFLDDNINHLIPPAKTGFAVLLAEWGYVTPEHRVLASKQNVPGISLELFIKASQNIAILNASLSDNLRSNHHV